jgi:GTP cyclohydrolase I
MDDGSTASLCWEEAHEHALDLPHRQSVSCRGNEALARPLAPSEEKTMIAAAAVKIGELLDILRIDHRHDHNTRDTPARVAKMLVHELLRGRFSAAPAITAFDNAEGFDQLIVTGPIAVRSTCAHHLLPIYGEAFIGILPAADGRIIGLSKYDRIVEHFAARFQIQEELVKQIGGFIDTVTRPRGLAVRVSAVHMCKTQRGVRASHASRMVSTVYLGEMLESADLKNAFLQECHALGRSGD